MYSQVLSFCSPDQMSDWLILGNLSPDLDWHIWEPGHMVTHKVGKTHIWWVHKNEIDATEKALFHSNQRWSRNDLVFIEADCFCNFVPNWHVFPTLQVGNNFAYNIYKWLRVFSILMRYQTTLCDGNKSVLTSSTIYKWNKLQSPLKLEFFMPIGDLKVLPLDIFRDICDGFWLS